MGQKGSFGPYEVSTVINKGMYYIKDSNYMEENEDFEEEGNLHMDLMKNYLVVVYINFRMLKMRIESCFHMDLSVSHTYVSIVVSNS